MSQRDNNHLSTDDEVLDEDSVLIRHQVHQVKQLEETGLPEGHHEDGLHRQELVHRLERCETLFCGEVEEHKIVK